MIHDIQKSWAEFEAILEQYRQFFISRKCHAYIWCYRTAV